MDNHPDVWAPLERIAAAHPTVRPEQFMFMGYAKGVHRFKHVDTRRYLNLDTHGRAFDYWPVTGNYTAADLASAIAHAYS